MPKPRVECEGLQGGKFTIFMHVGDQEIPHSGEYLVVDEPHKIVFTWVSPFSTDGSTVTLNFTAVDADSTQIELTHLKFKDEQARDNHEGGWTTILQILAEVCEDATKGQRASA